MVCTVVYFLLDEYFSSNTIAEGRPPFWGQPFIWDWDSLERVLIFTGVRRKGSERRVTARPECTISRFCFLHPLYIYPTAWKWL